MISPPSDELKSATQPKPKLDVITDVATLVSMEIKLRKIGNSVGIVLPKEALTHLGAVEGQTLVFTETPEGYRIAPAQSDFAKTMEVMKSLSERYRNTLRELAK